ncbi:MAG: DUF4837 family protein [Ichthyobacteriaceae bacterium]|nr:DUF4837 family protein [Ichthyobacteriaceae bacterium]
MRKFIALSLLIIPLIFSSCNNDDSKKGNKKNNESESIKSSSSGRMNELLVVMKHDLWKGEVGNTVREIFRQEMEGLPQPEPLYRVAHIAPQAYGRVFKAARNIIIIDVKKNNKFSISKNVHAQPQIIETVYAKNEKALILKLKANKNKLIEPFRKQDIKSIQKRYYRIRRGDIPKLNDNGISIILPKSYSQIQVADNFWWYRSEVRQGKLYPQLNLIIHITPLKSDLQLSGSDVISTRDSIGKKYVAGSLEGSYMQTEPRPLYAPIMKNTIVNGNVAIETRGLWMVKGDFMGGPFLNYTIFDEKNNRIITAEGFIYAAGTKKRDYVFEMEAIIKSIRIK